MPSLDLVVSIVIYRPNWGHLHQVLDSLKASTISWEAYIFDNSPEPQPQSLFSEHPQLHYHYNNGQNWGFGKAHNFNMETHGGKSKYFLILNPDIYFDKNLLHNMISRMESDAKIGLSIPKVIYPDGRLQRVNRRLPRPIDYVMSFLNNKFKGQLADDSHRRWLLQDMDLNRDLQCPVISGCFMFFRTHVLQEMKGFDPRFFLFAEDTDLSRRVALHYKTVVFSQLQAIHHHNRGAYRNMKLLLLFSKNLVIYFNKWGWFADPERKLLNQKVDYYHTPH